MSVEYAAGGIAVLEPDVASQSDFSAGSESFVIDFQSSGGIYSSEIAESTAGIGSLLEAQEPRQLHPVVPGIGDHRILEFPTNHQSRVFPAQLEASEGNLIQQIDATDSVVGGYDGYEGEVVYAFSKFPIARSHAEIAKSRRRNTRELASYIN